MLRPALVALLPLSLSLAGCNEDRGSISRSDTGNPEAPAFLLGTVDGCRVYRLRDRGAQRDVYVATCGSGAKAQWTEGCGKGCTRDLQALTLRSSREDR